MLITTVPGRSHLARAEDAARVVPIYLPENLVGQTDAVDPPAPLRRDGAGRVIEILVLRLQETEVTTKHLRPQVLLRKLFAGIGCRIGAEQDAVLIALEEPPRRAWLPPQLADARADLDVQIAIPV